MIISQNCGNPSGVQTNISIIQGETVALSLTIQANGAALNLTGYSFKSQINFETPIEFTSGGGAIVVTDAVNGIVQLNMSSTTTAAFPTNYVPWDFWMIAPNGAETPLIQGIFSVTPSVSPVP